MEQIKWHDNLKTGVEIIDKEHKQLFSTMNKLLRISGEEDKTEWACREGVKYLKNHAIEHFEHEEAYMKSIGYEDFELHKRLHDDFRFETLPALEEELVETDYSQESVRHFLGVCIGWVVAHTQTEDLAIIGKNTGKWMDIPHEKEQDVLEQALIQLTKDMFGLSTKKISEQYSGEDFGKIICSRLVYRGQKKKKREVMLVFEERLLLYTIGRMLNTEYQKVDDMIINITRYISRQFLEKISETIPAIDLHEIEKESLLTYEQLVNSFAQTHPSCSLLFDTGEGYFAFCMATPDSDRETFAAAIDKTNVLNAVNDYINMDKSKKKILVVDDSEFMRGRMHQLLSEQYEVSEADSSVAAIKNIAVNRPDLILLDYEMPVCDGRQTLEMIRADKEAADIPVIFLTGRGDRETVRKVLALKPEKYLLKTLPDAEIKKNIDDFFV